MRPAAALRWRDLLRPGDYAVILFGVLACLALMPLLLSGGRPDKALIRVDGKVVTEIDLGVKKTVTVEGPLGPTVVAIDAGRARIVSDPSPRQYCVLQGWLSRAGDVAICAPNRVSVQISGRHAAYDSMAY
jgi:hypothetical protein